VSDTTLHVNDANLIYRTDLSFQPSAGPSNPSLEPPSNAGPTTARSWKQQEKAGQKALDAFTELKQILPDGLDSQQTANCHNLYASCGEHIGTAAKSTCEQDFAKHYSSAYNACNQIRNGFPENTVSRGTIQTHLTPLFEHMTDLSRAAYIHQNGTKDASNLSEDRLHDYWVKGHKLIGKSLWVFVYIHKEYSSLEHFAHVPEIKTAYTKALEDYTSRFGTSTQTGPSPASPPNNGTGVPIGPISAGDTVTTPTQVTTEKTASTDLESALYNIRKLVPGADQQTDEQLTSRLFALCTPDSKATDSATAAHETSQVAETAEVSLLRKYQMPNGQDLAADITSTTQKAFGHTQAALDTLPVLDRIEKFLNSKYAQVDLEDRQDLQDDVNKALKICRGNIQSIGATDMFFPLSHESCVLEGRHQAISDHYVPRFELSKTDRNIYRNINDEFTKRQLNLSRQALLTLHPGKLAPGVFADRDDTNYFWRGGERLHGMSLDFYQKYTAEYHRGDDVPDKQGKYLRRGACKKGGEGEKMRSSVAAEKPNSAQVCGINGASRLGYSDLSCVIQRGYVDQKPVHTEQWMAVHDR
jgi:hypothetical protein